MSAQPAWMRVEGRNRCQRCGQMVKVAWKYFATRTTSTRCYCEPCVEQLLKEEA